MRNLQRIAEAVSSEPWFITPTQMQLVQDQLQSALLNPRLAADDAVGPMVRPLFSDGDPHLAQAQVQIVGDIAILPIHGMIGKHLSNMALQCGACDLHLAHQQIENIRTDPNIRIVVLDLDTPGGTARGVPKFAQAVADLAATKPVIAFAKNMVASAGYFIAAGCTTIVTTEDALVGSISTVMAGIDSSEAWKQQGIERKLFVTGQYKAIGMPGVKWTAEQVAYLNQRTHKVDAEFKDFVTAHRNVPAEMMQGQTWEAREVTGTLVDEITEDLESLLADLLS